VVVTLDVSDPRRPVLAGLYETDGPVRDVALAERTAYAVTGPSSPSEPGGFSVVDLSNPASPARLSSFGFRSTAVDVAISDGTAYIASGDTGLYVVGTSDSDGVATGVVDTPGFASAVAVHGRLALVADGHKGLRIVDVSDPGHPLEIGSVETGGWARRVAALGDHAYVAAENDGVRIVDLSTPSRPVEVGVIDTGEPALDLAAAGDHLYVAARFLKVFDVSDPANPREVDPPEAVYASTVAVDGGLLFAAGNWSFVVYDISEPSEPNRLTRSVGWVRPWGRPSDITVSGHHAYVVEHCCSTENSTHISVFDVLDPTYPSRVGGCRFEAGSAGRAAAVSGQRLYVAGGGPELQVFDLRCLTTYWLTVVAHTGGLHGSQWRSDVLVSHKAKRSVDIDFILHTGDGRYTAEASIEEGHQGVFEDIAGLLGHEGIGALEIQASHSVDITSRLYSETDPGTYGAFLRGRRSSVCRGTGTLYGLRQVEGEFRTSIIVTNTTTEPRSVPITLYRTDGGELARYTIEVAPTTAVHDSQPFKHRAGEPNLGWGYATVDGGDGVLACATVIDSRTNDALVVPLLE
jgi:hypothetical protein